MANPVPRLIGDNAETRRFLDGLARDIAILQGAATPAGTGEDYVTVAVNATLTASRHLAAGTGISLTDGGAGSTLTIANTLTSGGLTLLSSASVGSGATYSVTGLGGYKMFIVALRGVDQNVSSQILQCALSGNNGSSYGTARQPVATGFGSGVLVNGFFFIDRVDQTNNQLVSTGQFAGGASNIETGSLGPINALQFSWSGGASFGAGEIDIYGLK